MSFRNRGDRTHDPNTPPGVGNASFRLTPVDGFERGPSIFRFDPSGILRIDGVYHVYYTRFSPPSRLMDLFVKPNLTQIWLATSKDGWHWREIGQVLPDSSSDEWYRVGKHAPHVINVDGAFYLFFTAHVGPEYVNKWIGVAVADSPEGPFRSIGSGPLIDDRKSTSLSEGYRIVGQDDSCVIQRGDEFWWYFKGYGLDTETGRPINNRLCIGIAETPAGPYAMYEHNPITRAHTSCLWLYPKGVAMISDATDTRGDHTYSPCVQYSEDGIEFMRGKNIQTTTSDASVREAMAISLEHWGGHIIDAGVYCPLIAGDTGTDSRVSWGLSQLPDGINSPGPELPIWTPFIVRFDCDL